MPKQPSDKALKEFVSEAEEILEKVDSAIDIMDKSLPEGKIGPELINETFRGMHSLKGVSGMLGLEDINKTSHSLENMLDKLRLGKISLSEEFVKILSKGVEIIKEILKDIEEGNLKPHPGVPKFISELEEFVERAPVRAKEIRIGEFNIKKELLDVLTEYEEHRLKENISQGANLYLVNLQFPIDNFDEGLNKTTSAIKKVGEVITTLPSVDKPEEGKIKFSLLVGTEKKLQELKKIIPYENVEIEEIKKKQTEEVKAEEQVSERETAISSLKSLTPTVRVDILKLDEIMNTVGELMVIKSMFMNLSNRMKSEMGYRGFSVEIDRMCRLLERRLNELQASIMEVRMVPLRIAFDRLVRAVRKIAKEMKKEIDIELKGEDTELDKLIVEELADPLLHIVRNAIDHGIEPPQERALLGKPEAGKILINAYQKGNHVVIEVEDDGRGIDPEVIRKKAIDLNLISESEEISEDEILKLIFKPGFSTKESATEISGRGVGLDIVRNNITKLSGLIEVSSVPGKGTKFTITLPITLAIIQALVVQENGSLYAIALNSIHECLKIGADDIKTVEKREVIELRGSTLPLVRLQNIFGRKTSLTRRDDYYVVIVGIGDKTVGILTESLLGQHDVVIKPLGPILKGINGIAGATEMGDGRIALVLDTVYIVESMAKEM
jgi:two-component system chemotaxis sensor kinase CheA